MGYFQYRAKAMSGGFLIGLLVGWLQPWISGQPAPDLSSRLFLAAQTGVVFVFLAIFVLNYLEIRRRAYARLMGQTPKKSEAVTKSSEPQG